MHIGINKIWRSVLRWSFCIPLAMGSLHGQMLPNAPIQNFQIPGFNEKGYTSWLLEGTHLDYKSEEVVHVDNLKLQVFSGDEEKFLNTKIVSPKARFNVKKGEAVGDDSILISGSNFEITGKKWHWKGKGNKKVVHIKGGAKVTFFEEIGIMLE